MIYKVLTSVMSWSKDHIKICVRHSRHDERLLSWFAQHAVHKQRGVGKTVLVPNMSFIKAQPTKKYNHYAA